MARSIELIEQDIAVLQEAMGAIAVELHNAYADYLSTLGQALGKQLILASYHLCTQGYPEKFLRLSLNQRQKLQQAIRKLGQGGAELLLSYIQGEGDKKEEHKEDEEVTYVSEVSEVNSPLKSFSPNFSNPVELGKWQQNLENLLQELLKNVSRDANVLLQKAGILPKKLPEPILEAAATVSEASAEVMPGPPNLLNLVLEIENEKDLENPKITQIMAINLRLGEIEFADTKLSCERRQIRHILVQLNKIGRDYQKKQRERSVAEAESAWRASWFE
ncbi:hypothetical protein [Umezakia ovalisporum]|uniref:hypothetical protein n=1 Tax=Umezakia ovalisporum TaxID=75695 RepID=UPI002473DC2C|nr:hypothetical protein [Umezakia ovalisporum]MDH6088643.1 hypothetical protein [Umezakia ovalisporum Ak1311]